MRSTVIMREPPSVVSYAAIGGKKEEEGPMGQYFDKINEDPYFSEDTFEKAESQLQKQAVGHALSKGGFSPSDIDVLFGGDLLNQCTGTTYGIKSYEIPFLGIYGACSTMALGLMMSAITVESGAAERTVCAASSHYCTAERQYRFPLEYGSQRPPTAQWTVTGCGACIIDGAPDLTIPKPYIHSACPGIITDYAVTDQNNMGAAMAPADVKLGTKNSSKSSYFMSFYMKRSRKSIELPSVCGYCTNCLL